MSSGSRSSGSRGNIPDYDDYDDKDPSDGPAPTSRSSVSRIFNIVSSFDDYKKFLVEDIGFSGILALPKITRFNLKFSKWIMSKVDAASMSIILDDVRQIRFWDADVHKVFGIPCGHRDIHATDAQATEHTVQFMRSAMGMPEKGGHLLKFAENIITRPLSENLSSNLEKECFQMAFIIFVMGHLLAPSTKHDYTSVDYWGAMVSTNRITDFNWCKYVIKDLIAACEQVKADILSGRPVTHLSGCHVFLQVTTPFPLIKFLRL
jgi:hypothetical protein